MIESDVVANSWRGVLQDINTDIFKYNPNKPLPSDWAEQTLIIPNNVSRYSGKFSYDMTPYWKEPINHLHESSPVRNISILKSAQNGCTQSVIVPGMLYIMAMDPANMAFTAGNLLLAKKTIEERIDTMLRSSRLDHLIRPHAVKKGNQRTGDTAQSKEYPGGTLTVGATGSADFFRYWSAKVGFIDDFDTAPVNLGGEGSVRSLVEGRQNSFEDIAKTFFVSTPTDTATSQIWQQYQLGTQKKWHWPCPNCKVMMMMDWKIVLENNELAGMIWRVDGKGRLIEDSVCFRCPHCGEVTQEKQKYELNLNGLWIQTVEEPAEKYHESYSSNAIFQPPGFTGWVKLVTEFMKASPAGQRAKPSLLIPFTNVRMGMPWEDSGSTPKSTALMQNVRNYEPGIVPDMLCEEDGNGKIIMLTLSCDLGGIMDGQVEDVRLDWEILAHSQSGANYSVDQGSIGTFKRNFEKSKSDKNDGSEAARKKWTYKHDSFFMNENNEKENNSVWQVFEEIIKKIYKSQAGREWDIMVTVVDTGFFEKMATLFILKMQDQGLKVFGVKGRVDQKYRPLQRDTAPVKRSTEKPKQLYIVEVNQMKDDLAQNMALTEGEGSSQPAGFMNFPMQMEGKYQYKTYFSHFEGERRITETNDAGEVIGYKWVKKSSSSVNHFWDVRIYNLVAVHIWLDLVRQSDPALRKISWEEYVIMITE